MAKISALFLWHTRAFLFGPVFLLLFVKDIPLRLSRATVDTFDKTLAATS